MAQYAAAGGQIFTFADPVPAGAALSRVVVTASILGECPSSNSILVTLNPGTLGISSEYLNLKPRLKAAAAASCPPAATFMKVSVVANIVSAYRRGVQNTLEFSEIADGTCGVFVEFIDVTLWYWIDLPRITFEVTDATLPDQRIILLHKFRSDDSYPSRYQAAVPPIANPDGNVMISGTAINPDGTPYANQTIYLRQFDPPDRSPYLQATGRPSIGDNLGGLYDFSDDGRAFLPMAGELVAQWHMKTTDAEGRFSTIMRFSVQFGGENVAAEASGAPLPLVRTAVGGLDCVADGTCYHSGIFTTWRRVYLEVDTMFRQGAFIANELMPGAMEVEVDNPRPWRHARATRPIPIRFIHGTALGTVPGGTYFEDRNVIAARGHRLLLDLPLNKYYTAFRSQIDPRRFAGDAVGRPDGARPTYVLTPTLGVNLLKDAFVDYIVLQSTMPYFPALEECGPTDEMWRYCTEVAAHWFDNSSRSRRNHQHLVAANYGGEGAIGVAVLGQYLLNYPNAAYVWIGQIETITDPNSNSSYNQNDTQKMIGETTAHEMVHLYGVNPPVWESDSLAVSRTLGHCHHPAWDGSGSCLMSEDKLPAEMADGKVALHVLSGIVNCHGSCGGRIDVFGDSEYRWIRTQNEPLPETMQKNKDSW